MARPVRPEWHNEDRIESAMRNWLTGHGWQVQPRIGNQGADIQAFDLKGTLWLFEVKGYPATFMKKDGTLKSQSSIRTQRCVWFIEALGQLLTRMTSPKEQFALVFPDNPRDHYFEHRALELTQMVRANLRLWVFLLSEKGEVRLLSPDRLGFEPWQDNYTA